LHYKEGLFSLALKDFQDALANGADAASGYFNIALVHLAHGEREAARAAISEVLRHNPNHKEARELGARLAP
jgi:tetratricopeptide (TPR) repeat protein